MEKVKEFWIIVKDILCSETVQSLKNYNHHYGSNRYEHSISVAYYSYKISKFLGLDHVSCARGALLHDLFLYDCRDSNAKPKNHIKEHPKTALDNAKKLFILNDIEEDVILKHMWPITFSKPKYLESFTVTFVDKYCSIKEFFDYTKYVLWNWYFSMLYIE